MRWGQKEGDHSARGEGAGGRWKGRRQSAVGCPWGGRVGSPRSGRVGSPRGGASGGGGEPRQAQRRRGDHGRDDAAPAGTLGERVDNWSQAGLWVVLGEGGREGGAPPLWWGSLPRPPPFPTVCPLGGEWGLLCSVWERLVRTAWPRYSDGGNGRERHEGRNRHPLFSPLSQPSGDRDGSGVGLTSLLGVLNRYPLHEPHHHPHRRRGRVPWALFAYSCAISRGFECHQTIAPRSGHDRCMEADTTLSRALGWLLVSSEVPAPWTPVAGMLQRTAKIQHIQQRDLF